MILLLQFKLTTDIIFKMIDNNFNQVKLKCKLWI